MVVTLPMNRISEPTLSWMMDEFIHWHKLYLVLSATRDEILSWVIEVWIGKSLGK